MFKNFTFKSIFRNSLTPGLATLLLILSQTCWGAQECRFNDGYGGTTTLINAEYSGGPIRLPPPGNIYTLISGGSFDVSLTPGIQAKCSMGNDGTAMMSLTYPELLVGRFDYEGIFATNIPGIGYSLRVQTIESGSGSGGYFSSVTAWQNLGAFPTNLWDNKWINVSVSLFLGPDYKGNPNKITTLMPKAGALGQMGLGDPNDSNNRPWTFMVNENSFKIPIVLPTCNIAMLMNGRDTLDLGDYFVSDIKNNHVKDVPFSINLNDCTSVGQFTTKLTTTKLAGTKNDLLGNTLSSGAKGAGVRIMYNGNSQLIPNNANSSYIMTDSSIPHSTQINYVAQLVADGNTVTPGAFQATGVFTLSYD